MIKWMAQTYLLIVPLASFPVLKLSYRDRGIWGYTDQKEWNDCRDVNPLQQWIRKSDQHNKLIIWCQAYAFAVKHSSQTCCFTRSAPLLQWCIHGCCLQEQINRFQNQLRALNKETSVIEYYMHMNMTSSLVSTFEAGCRLSRVILELKTNEGNATL